jgi:hypothetical protein
LGFLGLVVALHVSAMLSKGKQTIDLVAHMVGLAAGVAWASWVERRRAPADGSVAPAKDRRWSVDLWTRAAQPIAPPAEESRDDAKGTGLELGKKGEGPTDAAPAGQQSTPGSGRA